MIKFITEQYEWLTLTVIAPIVTYLAGRRHRRIENKKLDIEALTSMQQTYDQFVQDLRIRYDELKDEIIIIKRELAANKEEIVILRKENIDLKKEIKIWEGKYNTLNKQFQNHKNGKETK